MPKIPDRSRELKALHEVLRKVGAVQAYEELTVVQLIERAESFVEGKWQTNIKPKFAPPSPLDDEIPF